MGGVVGAVKGRDLGILALVVASVPIVAVTSYTMAGDRERTLAAGCTDYLEKPIDPDTFVGLVARHIAGWVRVP